MQHPRNLPHRYFASGLVRACGWIGLLVGLTSAGLHLTEPGLRSTLMGLVQLLMAVLFAWMTWSAHRQPLFTCSPATLELRQFMGGTARTIPWSEITGLKWENRRAMCLARRNAPGFTLDLLLLSREERAALRAEVLRHLGEFASGSGESTG